LKQDLAYWFQSDPNPKNFRAIPKRSHDNFVTDVETILDCFQSCGFSRLVLTNLTLPQIGVPVVRAVVPGMEQSIDVSRKGARFQKFAQNPGGGQPPQKF